GNGGGDSAKLDIVTAYHNVTVTQGNGDQDTVTLLSITAGHIDTDPDTGFPVDVFGVVTVTQGNGYHDVVVIDEDPASGPNQFNNLVVTQGNNVPFTGCVPGLGDEVHLNDSLITSDITITQGTAAIQTGGGHATVTIGDTSQVVAGGW